MRGISLQYHPPGLGMAEIEAIFNQYAHSVTVQVQPQPPPPRPDEQLPAISLVASRSTNNINGSSSRNNSRTLTTASRTVMSDHIPVNVTAEHVDISKESSSNSSRHHSCSRNVSRNSSSSRRQRNVSMSQERSHPRHLDRSQHEEAEEARPRGDQMVGSLPRTAHGAVQYHGGGAHPAAQRRLGEGRGKEEPIDGLDGDEDRGEGGAEAGMSSSDLSRSRTSRSRDKHGEQNDDAGGVSVTVFPVPPPTKCSFRRRPPPTTTLPPVGAVGDTVDSDSFRLRQIVRALDAYCLEHHDRIEEVFMASQQRLITDRRVAIRQEETTRRAVIEVEWYAAVHSKVDAARRLYRERQVAEALLRASRTAAVHRKYAALEERQRVRDEAVEDELWRQQGVEANARLQAEEEALRPKVLTMRRRMFEAVHGIRAAFAHIVCEESRERLLLSGREEGMARNVGVEEPAHRSAVELEEAEVRGSVLGAQAIVMATELQKFKRGQLKAKKELQKLKKMQAEIINRCKHNRGRSCFAGPKPAKSCVFCKIKMDPVSKLLVPF